ncbi:MAG: hypothetical protein IJ326_06645 [Lachnospiraceae bacterium]|nr:hypothetical protein [Lachnospiraceae bacterium]
MEKPNVGRAILGFLISFLMICLLIADALLIGLKTTILKGTDIVDILQNADAFGMVSELFESELEATMGDEPMMQEIVATVFSEDMLTEITSDVIQALVNDGEVDLSGVAQDCLNMLESTSDEVIDQAFDKAASSGEISLDVLLQSKLFQSYEEQFGMELAPLMEEYVRDIYGDTTIKVDANELEALKGEARTALKEEIMPVLEDAVEVYIADVNIVVNQELQAINEQYHIAEMVRLIESIMDTIQIAIIALTLVVFLLIVLELLVVYRKAMNRGIRNIGVSAIFAGLMLAIIGAVTSIANSFLVSVVGISGMAQDAMLDIIMNFVEANLQKTGTGFLLIAALYFVGAVVCLILSARMNKTE